MYVYKRWVKALICIKHYISNYDNEIGSKRNINLPSTKEENFVGINKDKRFRNKDNKNLPWQ